MNLTEKKMKQLKKMPLVQTRIRRLKDTNLIIHQTIISDIRPLEYYQAVVDKSNNRLETHMDNLVEEVVI